jgi:radical SAM superfamily enzyme with C-terminal helix-hairpin-helix motif
MAPLVDPNTASEAELNAVPGLADTAVAAIMAGRPFATPTALHAAISDGLSEDDQQSIYRALFIKVGLNSGAEEGYKLIPSTMSPRKLAHEFEEYRPYESMDQFRREMAKYVSDEEVAYLSRYVTLD